jgi:hypothetical protein
MDNARSVIDYEPGDGRKRRGYPAWVIVVLVVSAFVAIGLLGNLTMERVGQPATAAADD